MITAVCETVPYDSGHQENNAKALTSKGKQTHEESGEAFYLFFY